MITDDDDVLMEIKVSDRYPMWLTEILTDMKLYRQTFSKYGTIYAELAERQKKIQPGAAAVPAYMAPAGRKQTCLAQY